MLQYYSVLQVAITIYCNTLPGITECACNKYIVEICCFMSAVVCSMHASAMGTFESFEVERIGTLN